MKKIILSLCTFSFALLGSAALADGSENGAYFTLNYHHESREGLTGNHLDFIAGYDRLLFSEAHIYGGLRLGLFQENTLTFVPTTQNKGFIGFQAYGLLNVGSTNFKIGAYYDLVKGDSNDPSYGGLGFEIGPRFDFPSVQNLYVEVPLGYEIFPAFNGIPQIFKIGLQVGYKF